jgi:solute carrier family 40 (iron-regulated transporter), member 1
MKQLSLQFRILLGRLLTKSGDQAWDFAVPIVLLKIFPDQLRVAALYFFIAKLLNVLLLPKISSLIDQINRLKAARLGTTFQLIGVIVGVFAIATLNSISTGKFVLNSWSVIMFIVLVLGGLLSSLGSSFMDIAIANDLVPSSLKPEALSAFNSRLRQIDLFTEVTSPVIAGLLLLLNSPALFGFYLIGIWNLVSFFPELSLIKSVLRDQPELMYEKQKISEQTKKSLLQKLSEGWSDFFKQPIALVALAYAFLWLSVLSPHGVLLTGFLKDGWNLPEWGIGVFRGAGAIFGLLATLAFPWAIQKWGLINSSRNFILYQTIMLVISLGFFYIDGLIGQIGFLVFILFSRIGLYGFSLGEMEIRQLGISPAVRGQVNGFASALTGIATLFLYASGALLPSTEDFRLLIIGSVVFVAIGCMTYLVWQKNPALKSELTAPHKTLE